MDTPRTPPPQVEGYLRLQSRVVHVSLSPKDPRRGSVCCLDGTSFVVIFPVGAATAAVTTAVNMAAAGGSTDFPVAPRGGPSLLPGGDGGGPGEKQRGKCACSSDGSSVTSEAVASEGEGGGNSAEKHGLVGAKDEGDGTAINVEQLAAGGGGGGGIDNCLSDPLTPAAAAARGRGREKSDDDAMDVDRPFGDISADKSLTGPLSAAEAEESLSAAVTTTASERNNGKLLMGNMEKLWDPVLQMDLFSCSSFSSSFSTTTTAGVAPPAAAVDPGSSNGRGAEDPGNCLELGTGNDYSCDTSAGNKNKNNKNNSGAGAAGGGGAGACSGAGSGGLKATSKIPFQACRVTWCEDGETLFLLNHAGKQRGREKGRGKETEKRENMTINENLKVEWLTSNSETFRPTQQKISKSTLSLKTEWLTFNSETFRHTQQIEMEIDLERVSCRGPFWFPPLPKTFFLQAGIITATEMPAPKMLLTGEE